MKIHCQWIGLNAVYYEVRFYIFQVCSKEKKSDILLASDNNYFRYVKICMCIMQLGNEMKKYIIIQFWNNFNVMMVT